MERTLEEGLKAAFPRLYREGVYCACWDGWAALLWRLSAQLEALISQVPEEEQHEYFAVQVKEKWGRLRFYLSTATEVMEQAVEAALEDSGQICEKCGIPGIMLYDGGWVLTRCQQHAPEGSQPIAS